MSEIKSSVLLSSKFDKVYTTKFGTQNFKFTLLFENGDTGSFSTIEKFVNPVLIEGETTYEQTRWPVGQEAEYQIGTIDGAYGPYTKIAPVKQVPGQPTGRKSDPNKSKRIRKNVSLDCAIRYKLSGQKSEHSLSQVSDLFAKWIEHKGMDEGLSISAQAALKMAITSIELLEEEKETVSVEDILSLAEKYFKYTTS
jgi:hypothetical protein